MASADLQEYERLQNVILEVERLQSASPQMASHLLTNFLRNALAQLETLKSKIEVEEKAKVEQAVAAASIAEQEKALSQDERNIFNDLLKKEFFMRGDMAQVDEFYKNTWDRLSERGKEALSEKTWEGVRRGEYKISELPNAAEKEVGRIYDRLTGSKPGNELLSRIPAKDREEFIRAFEEGKTDEAIQILNRQSFTDNVSVSDRREIKSREVKEETELETDMIVSAGTKPTEIARSNQPGSKSL